MIRSNHHQRRKENQVLLKLILASGLLLIPIAPSQAESVGPGSSAGAAICEALQRHEFQLSLLAPAAASSHELLSVSFELTLQQSLPLPAEIGVELGAILALPDSLGSHSLRFACHVDNKASTWSCQSTQLIPASFGGEYQLQPFVIVSQFLETPGPGNPAYVLCANSPQAASQPLKVWADPETYDVQGPRLEKMSIEEDRACVNDSVHIVVTAQDPSGIDLSKVDSHLTRPGKQDYQGFPLRQIEALGSDQFRLTIPLTGFKPDRYEIQFVQLFDSVGNFSILRTQSGTQDRIEVIECGL